MTGPVCTVIIPTLNEASSLPNLLDDLADCPRVERIIISDGGSVDATCDIARSRGVTVVSGPAGRGEQLRRGASAAPGPWYVFLHADSRLDAGATSALNRFLEGATPTEFAHFELVFDAPESVFRFIEFGQRLRERLFGMPYGDQGLVVSQALYNRVGGFPDWPIMEDVGIIDRLSRGGRRVVLGATLTTSGRRYRREGPLRVLLRNVTLVAAFRLGADPEALARRYEPECSEVQPDVAPSGGREVIVFARAPVPGRVKTRLAADLGPERATRIYRWLGRATVDALRPGPWAVTVYVEPPDDVSTESVRDWLGHGVEYQGQTAGDLGTRMAAAIADALGRTSAVCVVGTDIPDVHESTVQDAFDALETHDLVLGPATDGGYYLVGLTQPRPELFRDIPWSTDRVLELTLERAHAAGLRVAALEPRTDVDTVEDVPAALLEV